MHVGMMGFGGGHAQGVGEVGAILHWWWGLFGQGDGCSLVVYRGGGTVWVKSKPLGLVLDVLRLLVLPFLEFGSFGSVFTYSNLFSTIFELPGFVSITFAAFKLPELILLASLMLAVLPFLFIHFGVPSYAGPVVLKFHACW